MLRLQVITTQGSMVDPEKDLVTVDNKKISMTAPKLYYFMVNKPKVGPAKLHWSRNADTSELLSPGLPTAFRLSEAASPPSAAMVFLP